MSCLVDGSDLDNPDELEDFILDMILEHPRTSSITSDRVFENAFAERIINFYKDDITDIGTKNETYELAFSSDDLYNSSTPYNLIPEVLLIAELEFISWATTHPRTDIDFFEYHRKLISLNRLTSQNLLNKVKSMNNFVMVWGSLIKDYPDVAAELYRIPILHPDEISAAMQHGIDLEIVRTLKPE